ncbi:hypothetical protein THAOC_20143 [Thalassiosira oceanica]|uniref:Uncharacterized protein n=1 Tax=Thalassiosira oceanica TaxID=159749 RepID=K0SF80_THAOC|nr:hypothetical protein THAOC_20143 [Thalassiosira oceanica]|eukprot:EJK59606.1 hypothetical protein THAOC_20143 [Thalassiosira oceanica]
MPALLLATRAGCTRPPGFGSVPRGALGPRWLDSSPERYQRMGNLNQCPPDDRDAGWGTTSAPAPAGSFEEARLGRASTGNRRQGPHDGIRSVRRARTGDARGGHGS